MIAEPAAGLAPPLQLDLGFAVDANGRSFLRRQLARHPVHVCRGLYLSGDPPGLCSIVLQSSSGGLFEHERLALRISTAPGSQAHVSTAASTIVHSMTHGHAEQQLSLHVAEGSLLEYMPGPLILCPGSRLRNHVLARVHPRGTLIACDSFLPHDPAGNGRPFAELLSGFELREAGNAGGSGAIHPSADLPGRLLARDTFCTDGARAAAALAGAAGVGPTGRGPAPSTRVQGSLLIAHRQGLGPMLAHLRAQCADPAVYLGASLLPNDAGIVLRALSHDPVALRHSLRQAWATARELVTGVKSLRPSHNGP